MPNFTVLSVGAKGDVWSSADNQTFWLKDIENPSEFFSMKRREYTEKGLAPDYLVYNYISADTTHNCNLRCSFCIDDFSQATSSRMTREDFVKLISMAEIVPDGMLFLSCRFEPFLHPRFPEFLSLVPEIGRRKCFFTTNLCVKRFKPDVFEALANANLHYFNISVDSLTPSTFEYLRVNADFDVFWDNLTNLRKTFAAAKNPPRLRFISVVVRSNYTEMFDLVRRSHEEFGVVQHEVRMPFTMPYAPKEWAEHESLTADEWRKLDAHLVASHLAIKVMPDMETARYYGPAIENLSV